jgi:hypothetical protein
VWDGETGELLTELNVRHVSPTFPSQENVP